MLSEEKYLEIFNQRFKEHFPTPPNCETDIQKTALDMREDSLTPNEAAWLISSWINDATAHAATPEGQQDLKDDEARRKRLWDNLGFIKLWNKYEILWLLRKHVDISKVTTAWLIQFRDDLDLMV